MKNLNDISVAHRTVFLRVDFNVPLNDSGEITEDARIKAALTTIEYLIQQKARIVIGSHLGRPEGKFDERYRMAPVVARLEQLLGITIRYVDDCVGPAVEDAKARLQAGEVLMLENLRFYPEEEQNDIHFAQQLSQGIDVYVNDAFGVIHRKHTSVHALPSIIFDHVAGFLLEEELNALEQIAHNPRKPFVVMMGGVKLSDKVDVIRHLAPMADAVLLAGGVANAFLKAQGMEIGASRVEEGGKDFKEGEDPVTTAARIWDQFEREKSEILEAIDPTYSNRLVLPIDHIIAPSPETPEETRIISAQEAVPDGWMILDIGPRTAELYTQVLQNTKTIFWNGPLGVFEVPAFANGSQAVAKAIADSDAYSVLGGGDTESVVNTFGLMGHFGHVSTGGGASLQMVAGQSLPGLEALQ